MPRSGTTWLARLLASSPGTALAGREPMNPRGRQYGLGRTLTGWTELREPTPAQRRALRTAYTGVNPQVFSRYGRRQWQAPLPWTRVVVKDPFALLSLPAVTATTGAVPVVLFRHPGAALHSYRRVGWDPDLDEINPVLAAHRERRGDTRAPAWAEPRTVEAMALFWSALYEIALDNLDASPGTVVVAHEELGRGGAGAAARLFAALGLAWTENSAAELGTGGSQASADAERLHNFDRAPEDVASAWRAHVDDDELARIEAVTRPVMDRLTAARLDLAHTAGSS